MGIFARFIADSSAKKTREVNPVAFKRNTEKSIAYYIVNGVKVIESLPYIKFVSWKHIEDASKIDIKLNRRHLKDRRIQKMKEINKLVPIRETSTTMLEMTFRIDYDGDYRLIKKRLLIPSYVDDYHLLINGKKILPLKQVVDTSTYNKKGSVMLKTALTPVDIYKTYPKDEFETTKGKKFAIETFILNIFKKEINPLYYYAAKFGIAKTIKYFSMNTIIDVTDAEYDTDIYYYFRINNNLFVEVDKRYFKASDFVKAFTYMIYDLFPSRGRADMIDDVDYWITRLGSLFTSNTKNQLNKGSNVLISFGRILDDMTRITLRLDKKHLVSTWSLIRWELQNFEELRRKDNHDLASKRVRDNEAIAFYFIQSMSQRINHLLNKKKLSIEDIERIFNWNPNELIRLMISSHNGSILKYDPNVNDFALLNAERFTRQGPQGVTGGKNIGDEFRDIYPSHFGRFDLNAVSHGGNSCLTGFLTHKCKIYKGGFFSKKSSDPDEFPNKLAFLKKLVKDKKIDARIKELNETVKVKQIQKRISVIMNRNAPRDEKGRLIISSRKDKQLRNLDTGHIIISPRHIKDAEYVRGYRDENGIFRDENGYIYIKKRYPLERDEKGRYVIRKRERIYTNDRDKNGRIIIHSRKNS